MYSSETKCSHHGGRIACRACESNQLCTLSINHDPQMLNTLSVNWNWPRKACPHMRHCLNENSQGSKWLGEKLRHHQPQPPCSAELILRLNNPTMAIEFYKDANCNLSLERYITTSQAERVEDAKVLESHCNVLIQMRLNFATRIHAFPEPSLLSTLLGNKRQASARTWNIISGQKSRDAVLTRPYHTQHDLTPIYLRHYYDRISKTHVHLANLHHFEPLLCLPNHATTGILHGRAAVHG